MFFAGKKEEPVVETKPVEIPADIAERMKIYGFLFPESVQEYETRRKWLEIELGALPLDKEHDGKRHEVYKRINSLVDDEFRGKERVRVLAEGTEICRQQVPSDNTSYRFCHRVVVEWRGKILLLLAYSSPTIVKWMAENPFSQLTGREYAAVARFQASATASRGVLKVLSA
jgi:hypothetical protein